METIQKFKGKGQGTIFKSPVLELLTKTSPAITLCIHVPILTMLLFIGNRLISVSLTAVIIIYLSGIFTWTFIEYLMHRYLFHFENEWQWSKRFHYIVHGV